MTIMFPLCFRLCAGDRWQRRAVISIICAKWQAPITGTVCVRMDNNIQVLMKYLLQSSRRVIEELQGTEVLTHLCRI